jgi:HK97 family phage prohead protease|nr:MAG TPA: major capsid protein [Caudoviricetes sp.]
MKDKRFQGNQRRDFWDMDCGVRMVSEEERLVELSFSSEEPVSRWNGFEILEHKKSSVVLERIRATGCLLFNHNRDLVVGKIEKVEIKEKRGSALVRFDTDEQSEIIFQKVKNGTLRGVSVGYIIHETKRETKGVGENAVITYRITKWEPLEISIVSVPADISVGVGRSEDGDEIPRGYQALEHRIQINKNRLRGI